MKDELIRKWTLIKATLNRRRDKYPCPDWKELDNILSRIHHKIMNRNMSCDKWENVLEELESVADRSRKLKDRITGGNYACRNKSISYSV